MDEKEVIVEDTTKDYETFGKNFYEMYYGNLEVPSETREALEKSFSLAYALGLNKGLTIIKNSLDGEASNK